MTTATTAQINIRVDSEVKAGAERVLDDIGLSMSSAINIFLKKIKREQRIPFKLDSDPFYSESNMRHIREIAKRIDNGTAKLEEHDLLELD